jgi:mono/diheme cytochrome c family protein
MPSLGSKPRRTSTALALSTALVALGYAAPDDAKPPSKSATPDHSSSMARGLDLFKKDVRAILTDHCVKCHGGAATKGEFDLTTREALLDDDGEGPVVVPGDSKNSRLYRLVAHLEKPAMPDKAPGLPDDLIKKIADWIDAGAPYDRPLVDASRPTPHAVVTEEDRRFWSFRPLDRTPPPPPSDDPRGRSPVDRFLKAKLDARGITFNPPGDRRALIRRASFDLVGLPPSPEAVEAFVDDPSPDAFEKVVDRLLADPGYGERWARHWLDLARFAESHGYEHDYDRPGAYHYRDFVVRALNEDMPYDRFVRLQVAGDELEPANPQALMATGYLAAGVHSTQITANTAEKERYDEMDDMAATLGTSMLGLTVGCARCHDHKFDPIPTLDYYRLLSTFTTTVRSEVALDLDPERTRRARSSFEARHASVASAVSRLAAGRPARSLKAWTGIDPGPALGAFLWVHARLAPRPITTRVLIASEGVKPLRLHSQGADFFDKTYLLKRGDLAQKQGEIAAGFLQVLTTASEGERRWACPPPPGSKLSYRRTALAKWLTDLDGGAGHLLARVIVNRLWQHHFGRGIVATPSDFGTQGERPTHPELLDYLAAELIRQGWHLKPIHRLILTSAAYGQSSAFDESKARLDPDNRLVWRNAPRRLEAEAIRDAMLAVSGTLDPTPFGPGSLDESMKRRSLYFTVKRSHLIPILTLFDAPDALQGLGQRSATTVAPQALALLNNPQVRGYAQAFARRVRPGAETPLPRSIDRAYRLALARPPAPDELADDLAFVMSQAEAYKSTGQADPELSALADFCQALLGLNEFVYVE